MVRSTTVPLLFAVASPLGQFTAHKSVNRLLSEAVKVVPFPTGQGSKAIPMVPDVTGAEDVVDAVDVANVVLTGLAKIPVLIVLCCVGAEVEELHP